jgi:hypothetical protein
VTRKKRSRRYMGWVNKVHEYLSETGERRTARWLLENIGGDESRKPPNVNSATQKMRSTKMFECAHHHRHKMTTAKHLHDREEGRVFLSESLGSYDVLVWWVA